jgi:hypothetical protein
VNGYTTRFKQATATNRNTSTNENRGIHPPITNFAFSNPCFAVLLAFAFVLCARVL